MAECVKWIQSFVIRWFLFMFINWQTIGPAGECDKPNWANHMLRSISLVSIRISPVWTIHSQLSRPTACTMCVFWRGDVNAHILADFHLILHLLLIFSAPPTSDCLFHFFWIFCFNNQRPADNMLTCTYRVQRQRQRYLAIICFVCVNLILLLWFQIWWYSLSHRHTSMDLNWKRSKS